MRLAKLKAHKEEIGDKFQLRSSAGLCWRRGPELNRRVKVLQTSPLPLGYRAPICNSFCFSR
jgi:hypothetical protein